MLLRPGQLWGLRFAGIGLLLVVAAVIGGIVLLADDGSDDSQAGSADPASEILTESLVKKGAGLRLAYPEGWKRSERAGIVTLESPDRCVAMSFSAPATAAQSNQLLGDSIAGLNRNFKKLQVQRTPETEQLGGRPTTGALAVVRTRQGTGAAIRLAVSKGKQLSHLTQVVLREPPCEASAEESGLILNSIEFSR